MNDLYQGLLRKVTSAESLLASPQGASSTVLKSFDRAEAGKAESELTSAVADQIQESVIILRNTFALAQAFAEVASNMSIVDQKEAYSIVSATETLEKVVNFLSLGLAATSGILVAFKAGGETAVNSLTIGSVLSVAIGGMLRTKGAGQQSSKSVEVIEKAVSYARSKAEAIAVQAYLFIELTGTAGAMDIITDDLKKIESMARTNEAEVISLARAYVAVIKSVDGFYDYQLAKTQAAVEGRSVSPIFTDDTKERLTVLTTSIREARTTWAKVRHIYARSEKVAVDYLIKAEQS